MLEVKPKMIPFGSYGTRFKLGVMGLVLAGLVPVQAMASEVCNVSLGITGVEGVTPFFIGDELILKSKIGAGLITDDDLTGEDNPYIDFTGIGYGLDCDPAQLNDEGQCIATGQDIKFLGVTDSTCATQDGGGATFPPAESGNTVAVPVLGGKVVRTFWDQNAVPPVGETCTVDLKFSVVKTADGDNRITQAIGVPYDPGTPDDADDDMIATCSNELAATGIAKTGFNVYTCGIDVVKQVSSDNINWGSVATVGLEEQAFYRLIVKNTGDYPFLGDMRVNDEKLGIVSASVASDGLAPGEEMIISGGPGGQVPGLVPEQSCTSTDPVVNVASVEAWCRGDADTPSAVSKIDDGTATLNCTNVDVPKIKIVKDGELDLGAGDPPTADVGDLINYTFDVTNTGNVTLTKVVVTDPLVVGPITCTPQANGDITLAPEGTIQCTGSYPIVQGDIDLGYRDNTATVVGTSPEGVTPPTVTDTDDHREPIPSKPQIALKKQVSLTDGEPWLDADNVGEALETVIPQAVYYRFVVKNIGNLALTDVVINDDLLFAGDYPVIASLAVGQEVIVTQGELVAHFTEGFNAQTCEIYGDVTNMAKVIGSYPVEGDTDTVEDTDPAVFSCVGEPNIKIWKSISLNGVDFDDVSVEAMYPSSVFYKILVTNTGTEPLVDVLVEDNDLKPSFSFTIGALAVGESVTFVAGMPDPDPARPIYKIEDLEVDDPCVSPGDKMNTAYAYGKNANDLDDTVSDSDPALLECLGQPGINVRKQVRKDLDVWKDADDLQNAVVGQIPFNAEYRIIVENTGEVDLENVVVEDPTLGLTVALGTEVIIGDLLVGEIIEVWSSCDPVRDDCYEEPKLLWPDRCPETGDFVNVASASGTSVVNGAPASDDDAAWVVCTGTPALQIVKEVGVCEADYVGGECSTKPNYMEFVYDPNMCVWENGQDFDCGPEGSLPGDGVTITAGGQNGGVWSISPAGPYDAGDHLIFTAGTNDKGQVKWPNQLDLTISGGDGDTQTIGLHTSCSEPLETGDVYGSMTLLVMNESAIEPGTPGDDPECRLASGQGGTIAWYDEESSEVLSPADAWYRIKIRNIGDQPLTEVDLADLNLGIYEVIGDLGLGEEVMIDDQVIPELFVANACTAKGELTNTADTSGVSIAGTVQSSDWATLMCGDSAGLCAVGKPKSLNVEYDADSDSDNGQDGVSVSPDDADFPSGNVDIEVLDANKAKMSGKIAYFENVGKGDELRLSGSKFRNAERVKFVIYEPAPLCDAKPGKSCKSVKKAIQTIIFSVNCDQPLNVGDEFGAITITD